MSRSAGGKTALLQYVHATFSSDCITVFFPLQSTPIKGEDDWLLGLAQATTEVLTTGEFNLSRLPNLPEKDVREWLKEEYLSAVFKIIRPHRRLVWLFDDVERLINTIVTGQMPIDTFKYLHSMLGLHSGLGMALTIDSAHESDLDAMQPLIRSDTIIRLGRLSAEESGQVLRQFIAGLTDDSVAAVYRATGGQPQLLQLFGEEFTVKFAETGELPITPEDIQTLAQAVYEKSGDDFREVWGSLTHNERLVLTAIGNLLYDDSLRQVDTDAIETWLVETNYPLDATTINAAIRGLEYREIIASTQSNLSFTAELMQKWLLEHGRLGEGADSVGEETPGRRMVWLTVALLLTLFIVLAVLIGLNNAPGADSAVTAEPTVTLVNQGS